MSEEVLTQVILRMATDPAYAASVQADSAAALAGLDLSADEVATIASLGPDSDGGVTRLGPRSSKSALFFGSALHDATAPVAHHGADAAQHTPAHGGSTALPHASGMAPSASDQLMAWATSMDPSAQDPEQALAAEAAALAEGEPGQ